MRKESTLFNLFRNSEHRLAQQPPREVWHRLEQRLDAHQRQGRRFVYRYLSMAAAILFLVGLTFLISLLADNRRQRLEAMANPLPKDLEMLDRTDTSIAALEAIALTRHYLEKAKQEVNEGQEGRKLKPMAN